MLYFCFASLCDWSRKPVPLSQPIRFKPTTATLSLTFSRVKSDSLIVVEFLLAPCKISFALIGCCDYFGSSVCSMISMKIAFSILSFYLILLFNFHYYSTCTLFQMNSQWIFWSTTTQRQRKLIIIWGVIVQCFREFKVKANYNDHYSQVFSPAISMKTL